MARGSRAKTTQPSASTSAAGTSGGASKVDSAQTLKAIKALAAHTAKRRQEGGGGKNVLPLDGPDGDLKDRSNTVFLQLSIRRISPQKSPKPVRVVVPHAVHKAGSVSVCLLVKDPQREYKDLLTSQGIKAVDRVVGLTKLKGKFAPYEARRSLVKDHDIFLADDRIVPMLPKVCGKIFFEAKKNPITVSLTRPASQLKLELESAIESAYFTRNKGSTSSIKVGYLSSHTLQQIADNIAAAIPQVVKKLEGGWENVQNIQVKTGSSVALPIWNCNLGSADKIAKSLAQAASQPDSDNEDDEQEEEEEEEGEQPVPAKKPSPRKTRSATTAISKADAKPTKSSAPKKTTSSTTRKAKAAK